MSRSSAATLIDDYVLLPLRQRRTLTYHPNALSPTATPVPKILLIDDDPIFCYALERHAERQSIPIRSFESIEDFEKISRFKYDLVVMDYDLGSINGVEFAEYIMKRKDVPLVLISEAKRRPSAEEQWPKNIRSFVSKELGIEGVLEHALQTFVTANRITEIQYFE